MPEADPSKIKAFQTAESWNAWLRTNHATAKELWLRIYKKASGMQSVTWEEAVLEGLCWGWIDGLKKSYDEVSYLQRFTPRKAKSNWSKRNCENVAQLIEQKRMQPPGMVHVEAAKKDGRWDQAYSAFKHQEVPGDFLAKLSASPRAKAFYETLNRTNLYSICYLLQTAKRPETRERRMHKILKMLENEEKFY